MEGLASCILPCSTLLPGAEGLASLYPRSTIPSPSSVPGAEAPGRGPLPQPPFSYRRAPALGTAGVGRRGGGSLFKFPFQGPFARQRSHAPNNQELIKGLIRLQLHSEPEPPLSLLSKAEPSSPQRPAAPVSKPPRCAP